ncbi:MAG TPA: GMC family oxidoreductase N-terminal domain-containing protein, partial [Stellaceae bacterium]|nr:GMC family oxidoreductase N-terminal domain-containing protein [Stellaceae bacterium]
MTDAYDYVIVGAGTAGCVLANRLSSEPSLRVVLVEAGPRDTHPTIRVPALVAAAIGNPKLGWGYKTVPQRHLGGREIPLPRGRVLGGCSSINGMVYFRGHPRDFDEWAEAGNGGWSYRDVLPYFIRSERNETWERSPLHGRDGPMNVIDIPRPNKLIDNFLEATDSLQFRRCDDFAGPHPEGFNRRQATIRRGRRESGVTAYLDPVRHRQNLSVVTDALVTRIVVTAGRATGIEIERGGERSIIEARREVILSAGAFGSPQLLMLSGIGDAAALAALGIAPVLDRKSVGQGLRDHPATAVQMRTDDPTSYGISWRVLPRGVWNVLEYLVARQGPF